jgi:UPF0755 protein
VKRLVLWLLVVIALVIAVTLGWMYTMVQWPYRGYTAAEQFVEIPRGSSTGAIARRLQEAGVIRNALAFRVAVYTQKAGGRLQAGEYRFDRPMTAAEVVDKIKRGDVYLLSITFREGLTIREMAAVFENAGFGPAADFIAASKNAALVQEIDPEAKDLEGYLFPDTYTLPRRTSAAQLAERMVNRFGKVLTPELRATANERGLTVRELVTLAALVEKETARPDERPIVAGVYTNRLRIGMGLQCDPTVIYALMLAGRYDGNIRKADLQIDSPYNTYRYAGLPPGPIAAPGEASLQAAANPADVPYFYFVSRNDGSHVFSTTIEEHNRAVYEFQKLRRTSRP